MKRCLVLILVLAGSVTGIWAASPHTGDIVFQTSQSSQSEAIQLATHSKYSHMGLIFLRNGSPFVLEAIGQVQFTPLDAWVHRGRDSHFVLMRLRDASLLTEENAVHRLEAAAMSFVGKPYDPYFEWSDDRVYCSELVWKIFERGLGVRLGEPAHLSSFDLSSPEVRAKLAERFGDAVPLDEEVISPSAILASPLLTRVQ